MSQKRAFYMSQKLGFFYDAINGFLMLQKMSFSNLATNGCRKLAFNAAKNELLQCREEIGLLMGF